MLNAISFFTGSMGLDLGLEQTGVRTLLASEIDADALATVRANRPRVPLIEDVTQYTPGQLRLAAGLSPRASLDLVHGGPPCQDFSTAGRRRGFTSTRGNLLLYFLDTAIALNPRYIVLENVRGLLSTAYSSGPALRHILSVLTAADYGVSCNLYNTANYGVPQERDRLVILASRDGATLPYLYPTHSSLPSFGLPAWLTVRSAIANLTQHDYLPFPPARLPYYRLIPPGGNWKSLPADQQALALGKAFFSGGGKTGFYRRVAWDKPAPTLMTHPAMPATSLGHPSKDRPLSIQEYQRLQAFPDTWQVCGSLVSRYRQLGNAVPVPLGEAIGRVLHNHDHERDTSALAGFPYSRYEGSVLKASL